MTASSALLPIAHIFLCYILFSSFNKQPFGLGARLVEKNQSKAPPSPCSGPAKGLGVVHKYGPCSPFGHKKSAATSSQILVQDERRVRVINSRSYNRRTVTTSGEGATDIDLLNDSVGAGNYLVNVGFGTPRKNFNLILDTGSYVTWVRCQRCSGSVCPQQDSKPFYNPSDSLTSSNASCSQNQKCDFNQSYVDKTESRGSFVADTLFIDQYQFSKFVFLCADKEKGELRDVDGILGLGLGSTQNVGFLDYAFTSQTETMFKNVFCHCLPKSKNGHVYFGEEAQEKCPFSGSYTPLQRKTSGDAEIVSKYFVNLIAITIGQRRVEVSSVVSSSSSPGIIMDSGTIITRLPSSVYSELQSEFKTLMLGFNLLSRNISDSKNVLDTCYNLQGYDNSVIPSMTLHFQNLNLDLDPTAVTWKGKSDMSQVCLAFAGNQQDTDFTIIGNHQLQSRNILYNIPEQRVEIGPPGGC